MPPRKQARAALPRPTRPILIPAISIWKTSVVSVTPLCNKLLPECFIVIFAFWQMLGNVIPKTPQQKRPFDHRRAIKRQTVGATARSPHLPRSRGVVRKLKITSGCPVPFRDRQIVLIDSVQQSTFSFQKRVLRDSVLERRPETASQIFLHRGCAFLRGR